MKMSESKENLLTVENPLSKQSIIWRNDVEPFVIAFIVGTYITVQAFGAYFYFESFITLVILYTTGALMQHIAASQVYFASEETVVSFKRMRITVGILDYILVTLTLFSAWKSTHCWSLGFACLQCALMFFFGHQLLKSARENILFR